MPFAGHPTVGTAVVLAHLAAPRGRDEIVLEEGVGPVRVVLRPGGATFFMDGAPERRPHDVAAADIAAMVGVAALAGEAVAGRVRAAVRVHPARRCRGGGERRVAAGAMECA